MSQYQLFTTLFCRSILLSQMVWFNPATSKGSLKVISTDLKSDISWRVIFFFKTFTSQNSLRELEKKIFSLQSITKPIDLNQNYSLLRDAPFWNVLFPCGHCPKWRGGGDKACQDGLKHFFFPRLLFEQCPYRTNTFKKGASLSLLREASFWNVVCPYMGIGR